MARRGPRQQAAPDDLPADVRYDQFYTDPKVAAWCYELVQQHCDPNEFQVVEPSAGDGSFLNLLPAGTWAYDLDPKCAGVEPKDFLEVNLASDRAVLVVGNPPFGQNASLAKRFFNHAAKQASIIAMILPRSFRKASIENCLDRNFHLLREEVLPANAFLFRSKPRNVPAVFQIWYRGFSPRVLKPVETTHPDFEFTVPSNADFGVQRVGASAGRIHRDFTVSEKSHYFIKGDVQAAMAQLDFAAAASNVSGNPSLAKNEIVSLYREAHG